MFHSHQCIFTALMKYLLLYIFLLITEYQVALSQTTPDKINFVRLGVQRMIFDEDQSIPLAKLEPENIIGQAVKPLSGKIVIIDAADFGGAAGEARLIDKEHIPATTLSTHTFPLRVIAEILEQDTGSQVYFLGIQPKSMEFGGKMCPEVVSAAKEIINTII